MSVCPNTGEQLCGCCTGISLETPELVTNRPSLPAIAYRVGRYATFNASMLACLSQSAYSPMGLLRTRDPGDYSIALLDSWAIVLDILTFYQERLANEAYLRTAIDQRSVFELSRLVGYVPSPGVAASDVLAFTLSDAPGSPDNVLIAAGTRVQSVPGPGQKPQVFETSSPITARIGYNALPARASQPWQLTGDNSTWIQGTANNINVGDLLLFVAATGGVANASGPGDAHFVTKVTLDSVNRVTQVYWDTGLASPFVTGMTASQVCLYVFRKKAALYGVQAPTPVTLNNGAVGSGIGGAPAAAGDDWSYTSYSSGSSQLNLDATYSGLVQPAGVAQWAVFFGAAGSALLSITGADESNPNRYALTTKTTRLTFGSVQILTGSLTATLDSALASFEEDTRNVTVYVQSTQLQQADLPLTGAAGGLPYSLQSGMLAPIGSNQVVIVGGQEIADGKALGISGKRVRLQVLPGAAASFVPAESSGAMKVADNQVFLIDQYPPVPATVSEPPAWSVITVSGVAGSLYVSDSFVLLVPSVKDDVIVSEASDVATADVNGDVTTLNLGGVLGRLYDTATTRVNANAVLASNGETVQELLGSGDSTNGALTFTLKQSPLTYVSSTGNNGTQSTLQVWVNNLQWHEVPNLLSSGPADRVFVTRVNSAGFTLVQFGDGTNGARTPTGQMNIRAVCRQGIGSAGMVAAGQLSQPLDRPQGLKAATNPSAAAGGADPATADDARARAPLPTLTIGRVVSLEDYRNYALAFGGIAKAAASWTFFNGQRGVFLTVAGANGVTFAPTDLVVVNLIDSLHKCGNKFVPLQVASYNPQLFEIAANIRVDGNNFDPQQVLAQIWQNLLDAFAFDKRLLGQGVFASDIVEIVQQTPGVVAMQLTALSASRGPGGKVPAMLCAGGPQPPNGTTMLLLDPSCQNNLGVWS